MIREAIETIEFFETYGPDTDEDVISWEQAKDILATLEIDIDAVRTLRKERAARKRCTDMLQLKLEAAKAGLVAVKTDDLPF